MDGCVLIGVSDLLFQTRIEGAVGASGLEPVIADTSRRLDDAIERGPIIAVVDVHETAFPADAAIARARAAGIRVLAFGRHTSPAELRRARQAGADIVVPRSELVERLPGLLTSLLPAKQEPEHDPASL
jgi:hypothetical protein